MKILDNLRRRHARLDNELAAEQARRLPDDTRVMRLKKLKLSIKDRILMLATHRQRGGQTSPA